jgi:hypothetical protein
VVPVARSEDGGRLQLRGGSEEGEGAGGGSNWRRLRGGREWNTGATVDAGSASPSAQTHRHSTHLPRLVAATARAVQVRSRAEPAVEGRCSAVGD